jgi:hypothetical protein
MRVALTAFLILAAVARGQPEIAGSMVLDGELRAVIRERITGKSSPWLKVGETWRGYGLVRSNGAPGGLGVTAHVDVGLEIANVGPQQRLIRVQSRPQPGFASNTSQRLVLTTPDATYHVPWHRGRMHNAPVLEPARVYDFVLIERSFPRLYGAHVWHEVWQIGLGGRLLFDGGSCDIHGERLARKEVPMRHGYSRLDFSYQEARKHYFPHAESGRATTCEALPDEPPTHAIHVCTRCEAAYLEWKHAQAR